MKKTIGLLLVLGLLVGVMATAAFAALLVTECAILSGPKRATVTRGGFPTPTVTV